LNKKNISSIDVNKNNQILNTNKSSDNNDNNISTAIAATINDDNNNNNNNISKNINIENIWKENNDVNVNVKQFTSSRVVKSGHFSVEETSAHQPSSSLLSSQSSASSKVMSLLVVEDVNQSVIKSKKVTFVHNNNHHHDNDHHHEIYGDDISNSNSNSKKIIQLNGQEIDLKVDHKSNSSNLCNHSTFVSASQSNQSSESSLLSTSKLLPSSLSDHSSSYSSRSDRSFSNNNKNLINNNDENLNHAIIPSLTLNPHNKYHHHNDHINSNSGIYLQHHCNNQLSIHEDSSRNIELNGKKYTRLNILGKGGSSCVYRIISNDDGQVYAYKRIEVKDSDDIDTVFDNYANEILLLKKLRFDNNDDDDDSADNETEKKSNNVNEVGIEIGKHKNSSSSLSSYTPSSSSSSIFNVNRIIELIDYEICRSQHYIAMILEAGDIDLAKVLNQKSSSSSSVANNQNNKITHGSSSNSSSSSSFGSKDDKINSLLDPFFARMVWRQMLEAVDHIHKHRIVHGKM
jgi:hypothetical protein